MKNIRFIVEAKYSDGTEKTWFTVTEHAARNKANAVFGKDELAHVEIFDSVTGRTIIYDA